MRVVIGCLLMVLWVSSMLLLPGCGEPSAAEAAEASRDRPLSFVVINNTGGEMTQIGIDGTNFPMGFSDLEKGATGQIAAKSLELPEHLTLYWSDPRGDRKEGSVDVWSELGASYSGPVKLTVTRRGKVVLSGG